MTPGPYSSEAEEVAPNAGSLVESLRDFGYTLPSALADLIDNSLTADAKTVDITLEASENHSHLCILDDGRGMDLQALIAAMRMGTAGPQVTRDQKDLGRFGLGLKTASLSQGRCLTVITKTASTDQVTLRRWDIDHIQRTGRWQLLQEPTAIADKYLAKVAGLKSGTAVVIENLDRASFLNMDPNQQDKHLANALSGIREHLAMVFHRFIEDGVTIRLGSTTIQSWNPFLTGQSTRLASELLCLGDSQINVTPFVLPHHGNLTDDQHAQASGPNGWNAHQGFYIYRCKRLIVPGSWLNLGLRKDEHCKLARIQVDLPNSVDSLWHLNVMKSHVNAPAHLRDDFKRIAAAVRKQASDVYRFRGERIAPVNAPPMRYLWRREETRKGVKYRIDRTHPMVQSLLHDGCSHEKILGQLLDIVEHTVPIASMLQEPAKTLEGTLDRDKPTDMNELAGMVAHCEQFLVRGGLSPAEARTRVLSMDPFLTLREELIAYLSSSH